MHRHSTPTQLDAHSPKLLDGLVVDGREHRVDPATIDQPGQPTDVICVKVRQHERRHVMNPEVAQARVDLLGRRPDVDHDSAVTVPWCDDECIALADIALRHEPSARRPRARTRWEHGPDEDGGDDHPCHRNRIGTNAGVISAMPTHVRHPDRDQAPEGHERERDASSDTQHLDLRGDGGNAGDPFTRPCSDPREKVGGRFADRHHSKHGGTEPGQGDQGNDRHGDQVRRDSGEADKSAHGQQHRSRRDLRRDGDRRRHGHRNRHPVSPP